MIDNTFIQGLFKDNIFKAPQNHNKIHLEGEDKNSNQNSLNPSIIKIMLLYCGPALTKEKVWLWYGKGWAISDPYLEMLWEGIMMIWNWYGSSFCQISRCGKCMGKNLDGICYMGELWGKNTHSCFIDMRYLLTNSHLWILYGISILSIA